jgi:hypothetical protein
MIVISKHWPTLPLRKYSSNIFMLEIESIAGHSAAASQWQIQLTLLRIENETVCFVAQCLNQLRHCLRRRNGTTECLMLETNIIVTVFNSVLISV